MSINVSLLDSCWGDFVMAGLTVLVMMMEQIMHARRLRAVLDGTVDIIGVL